MKNDMKNKQVPDYVLDSSYVLCSCALQPPKGIEGDNKYEVKNFDYYGLLKAGDVNNGVFGSDSPLVQDTDCIPYINITPFKGCQSKYYYDVVLSLMYHASQEQNKYKTGTAGYSNFNSKYVQYFNILQAYPEGSYSYPCVLELLDSWFHTDDKTLMSNAIAKYEEAKENQDSGFDKVYTNLKKVEEKLNEYYIKTKSKMAKEAAEALELEIGVPETGKWGTIIEERTEWNFILSKYVSNYYVVKSARRMENGEIEYLLGGVGIEILSTEEFKKTDEYKEWEINKVIVN